VGPKALIKLGRFLDFESISEYTLTVRVQNKYSLAATTTINIQVQDVNDNIPAFTEVVRGSVFENEPPGTPVMQVRAIDADGTEANNQVSREINLMYIWTGIKVTRFNSDAGARYSRVSYVDVRKDKE
jgi:hypothetical protein